MRNGELLLVRGIVLLNVEYELQPEFKSQRVS